MAQGIRIDLSTYQPGAYAVIRPHTMYALIPEMARVATTHGVDLTQLAKGEGALKVAAELPAIMIRHQVREWHVSDDDDQVLPASQDDYAGPSGLCGSAAHRGLD